MLNKIIRQPFGTFPDGREVYEFTLTNANGVSVGILNYGAIIRCIRTPNRYGYFSDITLGYDDLQSYLNDTAKMGAIVGRFANRIAGGIIQMDNKAFQLDQNEGLNCLHGGSAGFNSVLWNASIDSKAPISQLKLQHVSPDGDQGFPGALNIQITYTLKDSNELIIDFEASTDKKTVVSLTMHPYFNLSDDHESTIGDHILTIRADKYLPLKPDLIPTGGKTSVENTAFDFRLEKLIGHGLRMNDEQLKIAAGYDHCFVVNKQSDWTKPMASVYHPDSGRMLEVFSNAPGIQMYSSNFLNESVSGRGGMRFKKHNAVCLEPQEFPNAPNEPSFPSALLNPEEIYKHTISFKFGIQE
ncbi:MAG: galactose mutarotase [Candidatus Marinimicrobia bacterium]|nr:galactose mutarotase [Candidatus Neomarinimicrobiota bacterium]